jgi:hypothetical protein
MGKVINRILWIFPPIRWRIMAVEDRILKSENGDWKEFRDAQVNETLVTGVSVSSPVLFLKIWPENDTSMIVWADSGLRRCQAAIFAQVAVTALSLEDTPSSARALHVMALVFGLISTITACWNQNTLGSFNKKATHEEKIKGWMTVGGKNQEASVFAATQLAFPGLLLFLSAVFLVAGLGVHISEVWRGGGRCGRLELG